MICEVCGGRGWVLNRLKKLGEPCSFCGGRGELSWGAVARKLGERPTTLARVRQLRSRTATCQRVLGKVSKLLWPRGQLELLS